MPKKDERERDIGTVRLSEKERYTYKIVFGNESREKERSKKVRIMCYCCLPCELTARKRECVGGLEREREREIVHGFESY